MARKAMIITGDKLVRWGSADKEALEETINSKQQGVPEIAAGSTVTIVEVIEEYTIGVKKTLEKKV